MRPRRLIVLHMGQPTPLLEWKGAFAAIYSAECGAEKIGRFETSAVHTGVITSDTLETDSSNVVLEALAAGLSQYANESVEVEIPDEWIVDLILNLGNNEFDTSRLSKTSTTYRARLSEIVRDRGITLTAKRVPGSVQGDSWRLRLRKQLVAACTDRSSELGSPRGRFPAITSESKESKTNSKPPRKT